MTQCMIRLGNYDGGRTVYANKKAFKARLPTANKLESGAEANQWTKLLEQMEHI
jgi:hypothetical protein